MQKGVERTLTVVATVVSDTDRGFSTCLLILTKANRSSVVLRPGTGKIPNQNPKNTSKNRSVQLISRSGVTRCVWNQIVIRSRRLADMHKKKLKICDEFVINIRIFT
jgi:hypothetical protein